MYFFFTFICDSECVHVKVRGQLQEVESPLQPRGIQGLDSGCQVWEQPSLPPGPATGLGAAL